MSGNDTRRVFDIHVTLDQALKEVTKLTKDTSRYSEADQMSDTININIYHGHEEATDKRRKCPAYEAFQ